MALKEFVKAAHEHGIAVIFDVVYNHLGPSDLDMWQFDGWRENNKGGIYFYNDWRSTTLDTVGKFIISPASPQQTLTAEL
jgi:1,4-alpha-glucan branching enzyme